MACLDFHHYVSFPTFCVKALHDCSCLNAEKKIESSHCTLWRPPSHTKVECVGARDRYNSAASRSRPGDIVGDGLLAYLHTVLAAISMRNQLSACTCGVYYNM